MLTTAEVQAHAADPVLAALATQPRTITLDELAQALRHEDGSSKL